MKIHDKILLAGELLLEAANIYKSAKTDAEFAKSILLAGAVINIASPWLQELGVEPSQVQHAHIVLELRKLDKGTLTESQIRKEIGKSLKFSRMVYNSLKHAGNGSLKASEDLTFEADLPEEAYFLIGSAIDDFRRLPLSVRTINGELLTLLQSSWIA
ncbi:hypothetical protein CBP31_11620 [Oceanisphaera profunda]|uniref:HEPN domain-containing protein n=1 Tax=Oceanisphaera profunda TaxID=1416627 RepID=A0A1Y0D6L2_9GAMM|nr:hypothetical protein [Oceanisphaera profunda]ART83179.1 hypothetical protein CBP31_11620 [Oceanisphaera profunda]